MNSDTIGIPKIWAQYMNNKDCSQGLCSFYCPQWCYAIFPPPPPPSPPLEDFLDDQSSGPNFSPLVITIIGFLTGALLLVSYYAIISKYCSKRSSSPPAPDDRNRVSVELGHDEPSAHEPWFVASNGLDEALIKSIAMFKYKRGDGLVEGTDCSVCLSEFVEDERLRLLPKCSHAFHVQCIDTWLRRHSNCPLCRASVAGLVSSLPPLPLDSAAEVGLQQSHGEMDSRAAEENLEREDTGDQVLVDVNSNAPKMAAERRVRRSVSMDSICVRVAPIILEDFEREEVKHSVMKRSHSCGRWFFSKYGKARSSVIPF